MTAPIVIAGAGIAGLTAALALAARGHRILVVERRTAPAEVGAGLQLSPNASHVLIGLGLGAALAASAIAPSELRLRHVSEPRSFATMPMTAGEDGAPFWVTLRADLHAVLLDAAIARPQVTIRFNCDVARAMRTESGLAVILADPDGTEERVDACLLVGADGLRSTVRRMMGDGREPEPTGHAAWRALLSAHTVEGFARAPHVNLWLGPRLHAVHYPVAAGRMINLVVITPDRAAPDGGVTGYASPGDPADLVARLADACPTLRTLVAAAEDWRVWPLMDRAPLVPAPREARVLIGDAAHPMLPFLAQGAAMAIEDAAVLARLLPAPADWTDQARDRALSAFHAARLPRTTRAVTEARRNGRIYHLAWPWSLARDRVLAGMTPERLRRRYDWLYGWRATRDG